jgi:hypothetical protein
MTRDIITGSGDRMVDLNAHRAEPAAAESSPAAAESSPVAAESSPVAQSSLAVADDPVQELAVEEPAGPQLADSDHDDTLELTGNWGYRRRDDHPVLPSSTRDDTDAGWSERSSDNDAWLREQRPPHWD